MKLLLSGDAQKRWSREQTFLGRWKLWSGHITWKQFVIDLHCLLYLADARDTLITELSFSCAAKQVFIAKMQQFYVYHNIKGSSQCIYFIFVFYSVVIQHHKQLFLFRLFHFSQDHQYKALKMKCTVHA